MGLDMYLEKDHFIGGNYSHRKVSGVINLKIGEGDRAKTIKLKPEQIGSIIEPVAYWRKCNAIHNFFVNKVQGGRDECQRSYVPMEVLNELKDICKKILHSNAEHGGYKTEALAEKLLPPTAGFFFGSTSIDKWFFEDLEYTLDVLNKLEDGGYYYQASW
jgi:hypothetical protein